MMLLASPNGAPELLVGHTVLAFFVLGLPVSIDAIPPVTLKDMTAFGTFPRLALFKRA